MSSNNRSNNNISVSFECEETQEQLRREVLSLCSHFVPLLPCGFSDKLASFICWEETKSNVNGLKVGPRSNRGHGQLSKPGNATATHFLCLLKCVCVWCPSQCLYRCKYTPAGSVHTPAFVPSHCIHIHTYITTSLSSRLTIHTHTHTHHCLYSVSCVYVYVCVCCIPV